MNKIEDILVRTIEPRDNAAMAKVIRDTLVEFGAARPGTVYDDPDTDRLYELFQSAPRSIYYIAEMNGEIVGGAGIYPTPALPEGTCELVKIYIQPGVRGLGLGTQLIRKSLDAAKDMGYTQVYLESMPELKKAISIYERFGFSYLPGPMGRSGHTGCDIWMIMPL